MNKAGGLVRIVELGRVKETWPPLIPLHSGGRQRKRNRQLDNKVVINCEGQIDRPINAGRQ